MIKGLVSAVPRRRIGHRVVSSSECDLIPHALLYTACRIQGIVRMKSKLEVEAEPGSRVVSVGVSACNSRAL